MIGVIHRCRRCFRWVICFTTQESASPVQWLCMSKGKQLEKSSLKRGTRVMSTLHNEIILNAHMGFVISM